MGEGVFDDLPMSAKPDTVVFDPPADPSARVEWARKLTQIQRRGWLGQLHPKQAAEFFEAQAEDLVKSLNEFAPHAIEHGTETDVWLMKQTQRSISAARAAAQQIRSKHKV